MNIINSFKNISRLQKATMIISLLLFVASFSKPAFYLDQEEYDAWADSLSLFFFGWLGILGGSTASLLWLANPLYVLSLVQILKNNNNSIYLSATSSILALSFSMLDKILVSESGKTASILSLQPGYKLWLTSLTVLTIGTGLNILIERNRRAKML